MIRHLIIRRSAFLSALAYLLLGTACVETPEAPENPTWTGQIQEIMAANCVRCHGPTRLQGAPRYFRLDVYSEDQDPSENPALGAMEMGEDILDRAVEDGDMPPDGPQLTDRQKTLLERWIENGAPE